MNILDDLWKYGFHDTIVNNVYINGDNLILNFEKGIYNLDSMGNELSLTDSCVICVGVDTQILSIDCYIDINLYSSSIIELDFPKFAEYVGKYGMYIFQIFYSNFNSTILIEAEINNELCFVKIGNCTRFEKKNNN